MKLLFCKCGDCAHWKIFVNADGSNHIQCVTCGDVHPVKFEIDTTHEKLEYREQ